MSKYPGRTICQSTAWYFELSASASSVPQRMVLKPPASGNGNDAVTRSTPGIARSRSSICLATRGTLRRRPRTAAEELERQQAARIESRIDALQLEKAAEHQPRSDEQHEAQRHLGDDHRIPERAAGAETGRAAAAAKHGHGIHAERAPRGHHPEEHGDRQRDRRGESEHGRVDADGVEPRKIRRRDRAQLANADPGERDAGARAERR